MSCLDPEIIRVIVGGVVAAVVALGGFGAIAVMVWRMT